MKNIVMIFMFISGLVHEAQAQDLTIVDVRRNITLAEGDPVYKDFYISNNSGSGLKKNLVVTAVRKLNIRDASGANAVGEILVPVGQLKVIAVYDKVAVAREFTLLSRDELPMLEQTGIMTGDRIDLKGSFIDTSKPKTKRKVAEETPPATTTTVVAVSTTTAPAAPAVAAAAQTTPAAPVQQQAPSPVETANAKAEALLKAATNSSPFVPAAATAASSASAGETLEKTADSGNNTLHE